MTSLRSFRRPALALGLCSLAFAGSVTAGNGPDPSRLPPCQMGTDDGACRLPLKNGHFDDTELGGWTRTGLPSAGYEASGNPYVALHAGAAVSQAVYAHFGSSSQAVSYVLRFRVRADQRTAVVMAALSMSDDKGEHRVALGETTTTAHGGDWQTVELMVNGAAFAAPAHVLVEIANGGGDYVQVDDVQLVQADAVEIVRRR